MMTIVDSPKMSCIYWLSITKYLVVSGCVLVRTHDKGEYKVSVPEKIFGTLESISMRYAVIALI